MKKRLFVSLIVLLALSVCFASADVFIASENGVLPEHETLFRLTVFPTKLNDAMLVETGGQTMMIDGGSGRWVKPIVHSLTKMGYEKIDYYFNTHPHNDHINAMTFAIRDGLLEVGTLLTRFSPDFPNSPNRYLFRFVKEKNINSVLLDDGYKMVFGSADITFMGTPLVGADLNTYSCGSLIRVGEATMMLTADMTPISMSFLASKYGH